IRSFDVTGVQTCALPISSPTQILDSGTPLPTGVDAFLMARERADGGVFDIEASAFYIEDNWSVTPNLLLNLGLRVDTFDNKTAKIGRASCREAYNADVSP